MIKYFFLIFTTSLSFACTLQTGDTLFSVNGRIDQRLLNFKNCTKDVENKIRSIFLDAQGSISQRYLKKVTNEKDLIVRPRNISIRPIENFLVSKLDNNRDIRVRLVNSNIDPYFLKNDSSFLSYTCHNCSGRGLATFKLTKNRKTAWIKAKILRAKDVYTSTKPLTVTFSSLSNKDFIKKTVYVTADHQYVSGKMNFTHYKINKPIDKDYVLRKSDLTPTTLVKYGVPVNVSIQSKNMKMSMVATPLTNGFINQYIKLKNIKTNKTFTAKVVDINKVQIEL